CGGAHRRDDRAAVDRRRRFERRPEHGRLRDRRVVRRHVDGCARGVALRSHRGEVGGRSAQRRLRKTHAGKEIHKFPYLRTRKGRMAKRQRIDQQLFNELRRSGLRKRVARDLATAQKAASSRAPETLRRTVADLSAVLSDLEKRVPGRGTSTRSAAAKKAAATRKRA